MRHDDGDSTTPTPRAGGSARVGGSARTGGSTRTGGHARIPRATPVGLHAGRSRVGGDGGRAEQAEQAEGSGTAGRVGTVGRLLRRAGFIASAAIGRYCRLDIELATDTLPPAPALIVANHGFGGLYDLNVAAIAETLRRMGADEATPATFLAHKTLWTFGVGPLLEPAGFAQADPAAARAAFDRGSYVVVLPGGDLDAAKPFPARNEIRFGGRSGFAKLAIDHDVPIVPIVVVGAGESALVLSDGARLARWSGAARLMRAKTMPVSISLPWGLSAGVAGVMVPYLPLPTKLDVAVLAPMRAAPGEDAAAFAARVNAEMNAASARLSEGRIPVLGRIGRRAGG